MYHAAIVRCGTSFGTDVGRMDLKSNPARPGSSTRTRPSSQCRFFFMATPDDKGAARLFLLRAARPGFVRAPAPDLLVFPDYDGNGHVQDASGNILANPQVGLLFIAMGEAPKRLRVNGPPRWCATIPRWRRSRARSCWCKVTPVDIFPNCPRYIPHRSADASRTTARAERAPVEPKWKSFERLQRRRPAAPPVVGTSSGRPLGAAGTFWRSDNGDPNDVTERVVERDGGGRPMWTRAAPACGGVIIGIAVLALVAIIAFFVLSASRNDAIRTERGDQRSVSVADSTATRGQGRRQCGDHAADSVNPQQVGLWTDKGPRRRRRGLFRRARERESFRRGRRSGRVAEGAELDVAGHGVAGDRGLELQGHRHRAGDGARPGERVAATLPAISASPMRPDVLPVKVSPLVVIEASPPARPSAC
jgi:hypothetical protein